MSPGRPLSEQELSQGYAAENHHGESVVGRIKISDNADTLIRKWWLARLAIMTAERDSIRKGRKIAELEGAEFDAFAASVERGQALLYEYEAFCRDFQGDEALDRRGS